jgi:hypothetical protein
MATTPMAATPGSRKLLGAGTGRGVSVGGRELAGGGDVAGGDVAGGDVAGGDVAGEDVAGAMAKPEPVTVTDEPGCPSEGARVITGLPAASSTATASS